MAEQIVRDWVMKDRLARGLADYHSRRDRGLHCPDPLQPEERASIESRREHRLQDARRFMQSAHA